MESSLRSLGMRRNTIQLLQSLVTSEDSCQFLGYMILSRCIDASLLWRRLLWPRDDDKNDAECRTAQQAVEEDVLSVEILDADKMIDVISKDLLNVRVLGVDGERLGAELQHGCRAQ